MANFLTCLRPPVRFGPLDRRGWMSEGRMLRSLAAAAAAACLGAGWAAADHGDGGGTTDAFGYRARATSEAFEDVRGVGLAVPLDDRDGVNAPIGFTFRFYDAAHTSVGLTSEGYLTFGGPVANQPLPVPDPTPPNGVIAPFWADLDVASGPAAEVRFATLGSAPYRRFVAQWSDVALAADAGSRLTFQVVLFEATGAIAFRYAELRNGDGSTGGPAGGGAAAIGIEGPDGAVGLEVARFRPGSVVEGGALRIERGPAVRAEVSLRSVVAAPGTAVDVPLDLGDGVPSVRGLQGVIEVVPAQPGLPPLSVRALLPADGSEDAEHPPFVAAPDLAAPGPVSFVLPVPLDATGQGIPAVEPPARSAASASSCRRTPSPGPPTPSG